MNPVENKKIEYWKSQLLDTGRYFEKLYDVLEMSDEEFIEYTYKEFSQIKIHERTFNSDECANILLSEIGKEERKIKNSYAVAEQRVKELLGM